MNIFVAVSASCAFAMFDNANNAIRIKKFFFLIC